MTELDSLLEKVFQSEGANQDANKFYAAMLRTSLCVPIHKVSDEDKLEINEDEPFQPLIAEHGNQHYLLSFDTLEKLQDWAGEIRSEISYVEILGRELIRSVGETVTICLNFGTDYYKEFSPDEIKRLKMTVAKLDQMANHK